MEIWSEKEHAGENVIIVPFNIVNIYKRISVNSSELLKNINLYYNS